MCTLCLVAACLRAIPHACGRSILRLFVEASVATVLLVALLLLSAQVAKSQSTGCAVCIAQVYGSGGISGEGYNADFIELFNATADPLFLAGWSVEYASRTGENWQSLDLGALVLQPYRYALIQLRGGGNGMPLPPVDLSGNINLNAQDGKVRLTQGGVEVDLLGYGDVDRAELAPAGKLLNNRAAARLDGGCTDTNNNAADFLPAEPAPHNSQSAPNPCGASSPTPTDTPTVAPTEAPTETPTETPTDTPTATPSETPTETPTDTPTATPSETPTETPTETPIATSTETTVETSTGTPTGIPAELPTEMPAATLTATPTRTPAEMPAAPPTAPPIPPPALLINEVMVDPAALPDAMGEWVELFNADPNAVNLRGWRLQDDQGRFHSISADVVVAPGQYIVLARGDLGAIAAYVIAAYQYSGIMLNNTGGGLRLLAPDSQLVDTITWGAPIGRPVIGGASFERIQPSVGATWTTSWQHWSTTHADRGTPGLSYLSPLTPTPAPLNAATPAPSAVPTVIPSPPNLPSPTVAPSPAPVTTPTPTFTPPPLLLLTELMVNPKAVDDAHGEWFELFNPNPVAVNMNGWSLADLDDDQHTIAVDLWIQPGAYLVLGRTADPALNGGVPVDYQYTGMALGNGADELLLSAPGRVEVDRVVWGTTQDVTPKEGASLERVNLTALAAWVPALSLWSGSAGDKGSPGLPYTPPNTPTPSPTADLLPAPTPSPMEGMFPTPTPTVVPDAGPLPRVLISELMINPQAAPDDAGEWFEVVNAGTVDVNLRNWQIADADHDRHVVTADLVLPPGGYAVLAANGTPQTNGGVTVAYVYTGLTLANTADELFLRMPGGTEVDLVIWGGDSGLRPPTGASLQRVHLDGVAEWVVSQTPWPGSLGDRGSPGAAFVPPPAVTPAPTAPAAWLPGDTASALQIEEVAYSGSGDEYIVLLNTGDAPQALDGWMLGDAETPGDGEGMGALPAVAELAPGGMYVVARRATDFHTRFGRWPDAEVEDSDPAISQLVRRSEIGAGQFALSDAGDEVVLIDPTWHLADAVAYGAGDYAALGLSGDLRATAGNTLQRVPGASFPSTADVRHRFLVAPPRPFDARGLPIRAALANPDLDDTTLAVWGSLGGHSNFTPGGSAPPHYVLAAAAAQGLDFMAIADLGVSAPPVLTSQIVWLPAWRWQNGDEGQAVLYNRFAQPGLSLNGLATNLAEHGGPVQWQAGPDPALRTLAALSADDYRAEQLASLFTRWRALGAPVLPAGNANPDLPGELALAPHYTGLAVRNKGQAGLLEAVAASRGWTTTAPGIWLTVRAELPDGSRQWMGNWLPPANAVVLHLSYGDLGGQPAGLAIWQDGKPIRQLDIPPAGGRWTVTVPAVPGSILTAVATQADGDFAITAPLMVIAEPEPGTVVINEVLPAPWGDANGDGVTDSQDEFIELFNPGSAPVGLAGWQLSDLLRDGTPGGRFTFSASRFIGGGERLLLWRKETRLSLDNAGDALSLLDAAGVERDTIRWDATLAGGRTVARLPDGGGWAVGADVTPGEPNSNTGHGIQPGPPPWATPERPHTPSTFPNPPPVPTLEPTYGQAGGAPGSVAQSKLAGLEAWAEFRGVVTVPPNLFNGTIYIADLAVDGVSAGIGVNVYLRHGDFPALAEGDVVLVRGRFDSFRGEMELSLDAPDQIWKVASGPALQPLLVKPGEIGEPLEGRLVTFTGVINGWQGDSLLLIDAAQPNGEPVRVTVRSSLDWKRPYVQKGEVWQVTGVVSQFARQAPWNGGYRVLVRYKQDLVRITRAPAVTAKP